MGIFGLIWNQIIVCSTFAKKKLNFLTSRKSDRSCKIFLKKFPKPTMGFRILKVLCNRPFKKFSWNYWFCPYIWAILQISMPSSVWVCPNSMWWGRQKWHRYLVYGYYILITRTKPENRIFYRSIPEALEIRKPIRNFIEKNWKNFYDLLPDKLARHSFNFSRSGTIQNWLSALNRIFEENKTDNLPAKLRK